MSSSSTSIHDAAAGPGRPPADVRAASLLGSGAGRARAPARRGGARVEPRSCATPWLHTCMEDGSAPTRATRRSSAPTGSPPTTGERASERQPSSRRPSPSLTAWRRSVQIAWRPPTARQHPRSSSSGFTPVISANASARPRAPAPGAAVVRTGNGEETSTSSPSAIRSGSSTSRSTSKPAVRAAAISLDAVIPPGGRPRSRRPSTPTKSTPSHDGSGSRTESAAAAADHGRQLTATVDGGGTIEEVDVRRVGDPCAVQAEDDLADRAECPGRRLDRLPKPCDEVRAWRGHIDTLQHRVQMLLQPQRPAVEGTPHLQPPGERRRHAGQTVGHRRVAVRIDPGLERHHRGLAPTPGIDVICAVVHENVGRGFAEPQLIEPYPPRAQLVECLLPPVDSGRRPPSGEDQDVMPGPGERVDPLDRRCVGRRELISPVGVAAERAIEIKAVRRNPATSITAFRPGAARWRRAGRLPELHEGVDRLREPACTIAQHTRRVSRHEREATGSDADAVHRPVVIIGRCPDQAPAVTSSPRWESTTTAISMSLDG